MKRKIDSNRVYKLVRFIVILISVLSIIYSLFFAFTLNKREKMAIDSKEECLIVYYDNDNKQSFCSFYWKNFMEENEVMDKSFWIGIGLPIVFFGGKALINYVAPKKISKK